jgi:hypothetical protein
MLQASLSDPRLPPDSPEAALLQKMRDAMP